MEEFDVFLRLLQQGAAINPETQAAIANAQAAMSTASATWALFGATVALVVVGGGALIASVFAAIYAYKAVVAANETLRLESTPFIVVEPGERIHQKSPIPFEVTYEILPHDNSNDITFAAAGMIPKTLLSQRATNLKRSSGQPPSLLVAVRNVGRSPAVRLRLRGNLQTLSQSKPQKSSEIVFGINALPPGDVIINVQNYSSMEIRFAVIEASHDPQQRPLGTPVDSEARQRALPLASLAIFRLPPNPTP